METLGALAPALRYNREDEGDSLHHRALLDQLEANGEVRGLVIGPEGR